MWRRMQADASGKSWQMGGEARRIGGETPAVRDDGGGAQRHGFSGARLGEKFLGSRQPPTGRPRVIGFMASAMDR